MYVHKFQSEDIGSVFMSRTSENRFIWIFRNCFDFYHNNNDECPMPRIISSPCFSAFRMKWRLTLIRNQYAWVENMGFFLWNVSYKGSSPELTVKLGLMTSDSDELQIEGNVNSYGCFGSWEFQNRTNFVLNSGAFISDGYLRYFCEMRLKEGITNGVSLKGSNEETSIAEDEMVKMSFFKGTDKLVQDLKSMLLNGQFSDLVLKVEDREFKVHRNILAARSPVFAAMLKSDTKEDITGIVDIPDCSAKIFDIFLSYIYTGEVISYDDVFDLYYSADKYEIMDLKTECVEHMEENLSTENFCDIMILSNKHSDLCLEEKCTNFFLENVKVIIKTPEWLEYVQNYPVQANKLYITAMNA